MNYSASSESLKENRDFQNVYHHGKSFANRSLVLYVFPRGERMRQWEIENSPQSARLPHSWKTAGYTKNRVGISVSRKVGNSVVRHHLCRLVRESYRLNENKFRRGLDLVVIVRPGAREQSFSEIERALLHVSGKLGILRKEEEGAETVNRKETG